MSLEKKHLEMLYPCVRVRTASAGGSGTVIYSQKDESGIYRTYVVTCEHVIDDLIKVEKKWDPVTLVERQMETKGQATVELFYYEHLSRCKGSSGMHRANIVAYDKDHDIALLEVERWESPIEHIAHLYPPEDVSKIHVLDELFCVGAAMGHEPIMTVGTLSYMDEIIEEKEYWMSTAQSIFGNSGGSVFRYGRERDLYEFLGMPARITVAMYGFAADAITHMGYFVPFPRIYEILKRNNYEFIYDKSKTYEQCMREKGERREKERNLLLARLGETE